MKTDFSLLPRLCDGDPGAQKELRERVYPRLLATCEQVMGDRVLAEEIAADIWMDFIYDHVHKLKKEGAIGAYLRTIAIRRCVRIKNWRTRHQDIAACAPIAAGSDTEDGWIGQLDQEKRLSRLESCIKQLSERARAILRLRFYKDMTQDSIGQSIGVSKQYAGRVINGSLKQLRRCMERPQ